MPRTISTVFHFFLRRGGNITCQVTGPRQYSSDLAQGGLELPCAYTLSGPSKEIGKVKRLLMCAPEIKKEKNEDPPVVNRVKLEDLTECDRRIIVGNKMLNDRHINFAQKLLRSQFPAVNGLGHTLLQGKPKLHGIQIIFDRKNHWIVASNMNSETTVQVYDSLHTRLCEETKKSY